MTGVNQPTIRLPYPHPGQQAVMTQAKRFNWLSAGRRWRKTTLFMPLAVEAALRGGTYVWGAPTYDQVRIGFNEARQAAGGIAEFNQGRMSIEFPGGGIIYYRSLDNPDNARGFTADGVFIDEAGDVKEHAWYEVLRPMLIDTNGFAWIGGTPKGRNWFWREHMIAKQRHDSMAWQIPTLGVKIDNGRLLRDPHPYENPDIPFSEIEHLYETLPEGIFKQEILAQFLENEGAVFRNIAACINAPETTPADHAGHHLVCGIDWGKHNDYTVISVGCRDCMAEVHLDRFNKIDYAYQRERLKIIIDKWGINNGFAETNAMGEPNLEMLQREGLPIQGFTTTAQSKPPLIESLRLTLEKEQMQFLSVAIATAELEAYEMKVNSMGRPSYNAPTGVHDDTVIARALMNRAVTGYMPAFL